MAAQDLQSKLNRAIRAVIIEQGAGSADTIFLAHTSDERGLPSTSIDSGDATEHVMFTGNWRFTSVTVTLRDSADPEQFAPTPPQVAATERYNLIRAALTRLGDNGEFNYMPGQLTTLGRALAVDESEGEIPESAQFAADNADMEDFTVFWWNTVALSSPRINAEAHCYESELRFDCIACNGNFS
jgi:hypothetical protein